MLWILNFKNGVLTLFKILNDVDDAKVDELTNPLPLKLALELASLTA